MSFKSKKEAILKQLQLARHEYTDLSPKGSVDVAIQDLINEINAVPGLVTTSSCSGRVAVYLEGQKSSGNDGNSAGGKGGGKWLLVDHDPLDVTKTASEIYSMFEKSEEKSCGLEGARWVHFKFEPMILHILTAWLSDAQRVLSAALQAGFRESGAINLKRSRGNATPAPMVAVRTTGLALDSIIGYANEDGRLFSLVTREHLEVLLQIANERFQANTERISRFRQLLLARPEEESESKEQRRARKQAQGVQVQRSRQREKEESFGVDLHADTGSPDSIDLNYIMKGFDSP